MGMQKKRCAQCDFVVEENINFCPYCGSNEFESVDKHITMRLRPEDSPWYKKEESTPVNNVPKEINAPNIPHSSSYIEESNETIVTSNNLKSFEIQDFYNQYVSQKSKGWIIWFLVMNFVSSAFSVITLLAGNILSCIDIMFYLLIGIFILRKKSWISALTGAIYSGVGCLLNMILYQDVSGMLYVIVAIIVVRKLRKLQAEYKEYTISGKLPDTEI